SAADDKVRQTVKILLRLGKQPFGLRRLSFWPGGRAAVSPFHAMPPFAASPQIYSKRGPVMNKTRLGRGACLLAALALGAACLAQPQAAAQSFRQGVSLCLYTLLPALFPFLVLCSWLTANLPGRGL